MRQALEMALEALKKARRKILTTEECHAVIMSIKEALAQPEQEPVCDKDPQGCWSVRCQLGNKCKNNSPQRTWVGLTDDEVARLAHHELWVKTFIRKIEEKLRSKNT